MDWLDSNEDKGFRDLPKFTLSVEEKAKMLNELKRVEAESTTLTRRFPHLLTNVLVAGATLVVTGFVFFAIEQHSGAWRQHSVTPANQQNSEQLQAATTRLQKVTDEWGQKATQLHTLLTHSIGVLDAWAYGASEKIGEGNYSFSSNTLVNGQSFNSSMESYLQSDYGKFKQLFGSELAEIPAKPMKDYSTRFIYIDPNTHVASFRDDWAILDSINRAYQQAINYYDPRNHGKLEGDPERDPSNNTEAAQAANTLREWNDLLFDGRIQLSDVPKVSSTAN
ncbi:hypothetical protein GCM10025857_06580 [Alicyclobacillus contaminans]|uniref:hypothetical protein n=1 Tax=Alicyclobacillus contaminans TaxID=392016 RepID=UPI00047D5382|nr:hypothetical protein [Alicyclobacillus contaminans]GMA49301.1 hypothetical protein GCM10025857_06580 [Alicyclobacillus contaminans]